MSELYNLPDGWEWKTLSDVFNIERGGSPRPIKDYITDDEDGINWIKISDATKGDGKYIESTEQKIKLSGLKNTRLVVDGDFIMSNSMSFGKPYIVKTKGAIHDGWLLMREKIEKTDKDFFYYLLSSNYMYEQFSSKASGTTVKNLNIDMVKTTNIPLPPFEEQKRIVAKLDILFEKIDKAIALHQKNIDEADIFMASVLNEVFVELEEKYEKKYLDEISFLIDGDRGSNYPKKEEFFENEFCLFLNAKNVTRNGFLFLEKQFITKEKDSLLRKGKLDREDLIITTRGTIGNVAIYDKSIEFDNVRINSGMAIIRLKEKNLIYNRYIYKYLFAPQFLNYLSDVQSGSAQPQITIKNLKESIVPIPPLKTQQKVVSYLDEISNKMEKIKNLQKEKMQSLKALKASILDKAFKGEL